MSPDNSSTSSPAPGQNYLEITTWVKNTSFGNNSTEEPSCFGEGSYHMDFTQIQAVALTFVVAYTIIIVLAIFGNALVIWTVWRYKHMQTVTNYYIVNLAICDFLVSSLVMPLKLLEYAAPCEWDIFHSDILCSFQYYLLPIFVFASVLTLVAISIERYYAIVHPFSAMKIHSKSRTRKILAATWIIPIVLASPYVYCRSFPVIIISEFGKISRQICNDKFDDIDMVLFGEESGKFRRGFFISLFVSIYLIPMIVLVTTCGRIVVSLLTPIDIKGLSDHRCEQRIRYEESKRKVARMVIVVSLAFIVAWSPQYLVSIISQLQTESFLREGNFFFTMLVTHMCGFTNSCINPFIYTLMSLKFRNCFKDVFNRLSSCCRPPLNSTMIFFSRKCSEKCISHPVQRAKAKHSFYGSATNMTTTGDEIIPNGIGRLSLKSVDQIDPVGIILVNKGASMTSSSGQNPERKKICQLTVETDVDCSTGLLSSH